MKLLKITIVNIDGSFIWLFNPADMPSDLGPNAEIRDIKAAYEKHRATITRQCVEKALADLVENHGFFADNQIVTEFPSYFTPNEGIYGLLAMPGEDPEDLFEHENTYWIYVTEYALGTCITDRE